MKPLDYFAAKEFGTVLGISMKSLRHLPLLICVAFLCPRQIHSQSLTSPQSVTSGISLEPKSTVVVLGDSITYQAHFTEYLRTFFDTRFPLESVHFINAGIPGHRAADAIIRFDQDVARWKPHAVMVMFGMNDGGYQSMHSDNRFSDFQKNIRELIARIEQIGAEAIILSPTPFDYPTSQKRQVDETYRFRGKAFASDYDSTLGDYAKWLQQFAEQKHLLFINLHETINQRLNSKRSKDASFTYTPDAIHPDPAGHLFMAYTILNELKPTRYELLDVTFQHKETSWLATAQNAQIRNITGDQTKIYFEIKLESLPWRVPIQHTLKDLRWKNPSNAAEMFEELPIEQEYNRSVLKVSGLSNANYRLTCDGKRIGVVSQAELALGVDLERLKRLPWSQQAMEVAMLNRQISDEVVRPLRDIASQRFRLIHEGDAELDRFDRKQSARINELKSKEAEIRSHIRERAAPNWHQIQLEEIRLKSE